MRLELRNLARNLAVIGAASFVTLADASVLVHVIQNDPTSTNAAVVPSSLLPSADFTTSDINFQVGNSDSQTLATFLKNPTFINQANGFNPSQSADNTFLEITASTYLNAGLNSFVVGHDDGVVLTFANPTIGTVVNQPGGTAFVNTPFNVTAPTAGFYAFDLKYTECCGGPADLVFQINGAPIITPAVPEPGTYLLITVGLGLLGARLNYRGRSIMRP